MSHPTDHVHVHSLTNQSRVVVHGHGQVDSRGLVASPPLGGAAGAAEAAGGPAGVRVESGVEDETAFAAGRPADTTDGPWPGVACVHVRRAFLDGSGVPRARAAVTV